MKCLLFIIFYELFLLLDARKLRTVNLENQTVFKINPNNNSGNLQMIDKTKDFIKILKKDITMNKDGLEREHDKVENVSRRNANQVVHNVHTTGKIHTHEPKFIHVDGPYKFTDFIKDTFEILTTYNDESLVEAVNAMADGINKLSVNISNIHKLLDAPQSRRMMSQNLESLNQASAQDIRNILNSIVYMIEMDLFTDEQKDFLNLINSLPGKESDTNFRSFINKLRQYGRENRRANLSLTDIIRNSITSLFNSTQMPAIIKPLRKAYNNPSIVSDDGLTIETDDYKIEPTVLSQNTTESDVLNRLTNLEKQLDIVKKQICEISVKRKVTDKDATSATSIESEYATSKMEDKATETAIIETITPKVTTPDVYEDESDLKVSDDEFENESNNYLENKEENDTIDRIDDNNIKSEDKLKTTAVLYTKMSEEIEEDSQSFEYPDILKNIMAEKRNNEEDNIILAAALKELEKESELRLKLDKNEKHKKLNKPEKLPYLI